MKKIVEPFELSVNTVIAVRYIWSGFVEMRFYYTFLPSNFLFVKKSVYRESVLPFQISLIYVLIYKFSLYPNTTTCLLHQSWLVYVVSVNHVYNHTDIVTLELMACDHNSWRSQHI